VQLDYNYRQTAYKFKVRIPWRKGMTVTSWDQVCIWALEHYGTPGSRYVTTLTEDYMDFIFADSQDAIHFSLRWE